MFTTCPRIFCLLVCTPQALVAKDRRGHWVPLELRLWMVMSCRIVMGSKPRFSARISVLTAELVLVPQDFFDSYWLVFVHMPVILVKYGRWGQGRAEIA